jgi:hypothetical protein
MKEGIAEQVVHGLHAIERTEFGKHAIHSTGAAVAGVLAAAPVVGPVLVVAAPIAFLGVAVWGLWEMLKDA